MLDNRCQILDVRLQILDIRSRVFSEGGFGEEVTPVPIPNTEVKLFCANGTVSATEWQSRSPPSLNTLFCIQDNV